MLPAAGAIAVIAPFSTVLVRAIGTKLTVAAGLLIIARGLWQVSASSTTTTYAGILPGLILLGVRAGLTIPSATDSVMGSLPSGHRRRIRDQRRVYADRRRAGGGRDGQPA